MSFTDKVVKIIRFNLKTLKYKSQNKIPKLSNTITHIY